MVQAIRNINPETRRELVNVFFDKQLQIPTAQKICSDANEANEFIEKQYARAIRLALIKFAKQRLYIYNKYPEAKQASMKIHAAEAIINEMNEHVGSRLIVLASAVYWLRGCIYKLQPGASSRYRKNYDTVISPIVDLCFNYSVKARMRLIEIEKQKAAGQTKPTRYRINDLTQNDPDYDPTKHYHWSTIPHNNTRT